MDPQTQQLLADLAAGNAALLNRVAVLEGRQVPGAPAPPSTALVDTRLVAKPTIFAGDAGATPNLGRLELPVQGLCRRGQPAHAGDHAACRR